MTPDEITNELGIQLGAHPALAAFCEEMKDRQYGHEEVNDAWGFFQCGWDARKAATFGSNYGLGSTAPTQLRRLQSAVQASKVARQHQTDFPDRLLFLVSELGEVVKEALMLRGNYGSKKAVGAPRRMTYELCDVLWNVMDLANMLGIDLDEPMQDLLNSNKNRVWEGDDT